MLSNYKIAFSQYLLVGITFLSCMWEVMLLCTCLFFHSMPQKITGTVIAILFWFLTYQMWYKSSLSPGLPGKNADEMSMCVVLEVLLTVRFVGLIDQLISNSFVPRWRTCSVLDLEASKNDSAYGEANSSFQSCNIWQGSHRSLFQIWSQCGWEFF